MYQDCRGHTTGDYCDRCEEGYEGDATTGDCIQSSSSSNSQCNCDTAGSLSQGLYPKITLLLLPFI